ncbi:hypothetical protein ANCCAN_20848 [Ancylostoma caninum]|uniref:Uncharacterized protein n=1 Tax=Ancylostoma caninum TaxID=29170 RepID=A0A368FMG6_ANCCA|nr:hypothetical protein ANCCAN_20848 [Ancylostoma caninum]
MRRRHIEIIWHCLTTVKPLNKLIKGRKNCDLRNQRNTAFLCTPAE